MRRIAFSSAGPLGIESEKIKQKGGKTMKMRKMLCAMLVTLLFMSGASDVLALEAGAYLVSNATYYVNPDTGAADDGGDTSVGEGMCRNTVYPESFYEFKDNRHYMTIRLKLISFIRNIQFQVQQTPGDPDSYQPVSYTVTGENAEENTRDFLIELPAADALIKPGFFVGPMNRDVTFFLRIHPDSARKDDGSFAAFNGNAAQPAQPESGGEPGTVKSGSAAQEVMAGNIKGDSEDHEKIAAGSGQGTRDRNQAAAGDKGLPTHAPAGSGKGKPAVWAEVLALAVCIAVAGGYLAYVKKNKA